MKMKGFTLIEMLVVIAMIAILVSIIIPTYTLSTNKARAAANAANLRSVYAQLNTMKLLDPKGYEENLSSDYHPGISIGDGSFIGQMLQRLSVTRFAVFTASNGTIVLPNGDVIDTLPAAKVVSLEDGNALSPKVEAGTPMTVILTDDYVITCYGNYTLEDFADIAEDNKLDRYVSGG